MSADNIIKLIRDVLSGPQFSAKLWHWAAKNECCMEPGVRIEALKDGAHEFAYCLDTSMVVSIISSCGMNDWTYLWRDSGSCGGGFFSALRYAAFASAASFFALSPKLALWSLGNSAKTSRAT